MPKGNALIVAGNAESGQSNGFSNAPPSRPFINFTCWGTVSCGLAALANATNEWVVTSPPCSLFAHSFLSCPSRVSLSLRFQFWNVRK